MLRLNSHKSAEFRDGWRRRDFLHAGSLGMLGLGLNAQAAVKSDVNVIMLFLVGGPSQLDTWDMKPEASSDVRGPFRPIKTNVSGIEISEIFPRMARHADKWSLLRTLNHDGPAVHDTGHQLMQTGRAFRDGIVHPHMGSVLGHLSGGASVVLPHAIGNTGGNLPHGQDAGYLGSCHDPLTLTTDPSSPGFSCEAVEGAIREMEVADDFRLAGAREAFDLSEESEETRRRYGLSRFGQSCLLARRLVGSGVRFVTVNMFETVFDQLTWDIHGSSPFSPIECYRDLCGPNFDNGFSSLIEDLRATGELDNTLIVATGEFGRTPRINPAGGRDHWPQCWSMVMAGGGVQGGRVVGESDATSSEPRDRPISPAEVSATIYRALGVDLTTTLPGPAGKRIPIVEERAEPIHELFA